MKHLLRLFAFFLFIAACKKYEAEYAVNCQFSPFFFGEERILVVTNSDGKVLESFSIPQGTTSLSEKFSFKDNQATERYDLHFVQFEYSPGESDRPINIISHLDVPNGASVYFGPDENVVTSVKIVHVKIHEIESYDTLEVAGDFSYVNAFPSLAGNTLTSTHLLSVGQGLQFRLLANGETAFRHLYLPDTLAVDSVSVYWQDFKPETNPKKVELPGNGQANFMKVNAVSPDFKHFVTIYQNYEYGNNQHPLTGEFNHPDGLPDPTAYSIRVEQAGAVFEKIFQPGELLRFEPADMEIGDIISNGRQLQVQTSGNVDMLGIEIYASGPPNKGGWVHWRINSHPDYFVNRTLPELENYLPNWFYNFSSFKYERVWAYQFDKYDYEQVREGFPYKLTEPFSVARSGYKAIYKYY